MAEPFTPPPPTTLKMTAVKERFPTRGDTVTLRAVEHRPNNIKLVYEVDVLITSVHADVSLVMGTELKRFCYHLGHKDKGSNLPPENPYGTPKTNGYMLNEWSVVTDD